MGSVAILGVQTLGSSDRNVTKRRMGIAGLILLMLAIGMWAALPKHPRSSGSAASGRVAEVPVNSAAVPKSLRAIRSVERSSLWRRPAATTAARNLRRARFADLRQFGASEHTIDRLIDGDILAVVTELKQQAKRGDASAANVLSNLGHFLCTFASPKVQEGQPLPGKDAEWLDAALQDRIAFNKQFWAVCQSIDLKQVDDWVAKAAEQGNAASLMLLTVGTTPALFKQKLVEAVDLGYPEAQMSLAQILTHPPPGIASGGPNDGEANLFKKAAISLPEAESALALCEFNGCPGVEIDIPAAVSDAREAAQRGALTAMLEIGPQLQASMIDPTEVAAWNLVAGALAQKGCSPGGFGTSWMTAAAATLTSKTISIKARSLAEQYWQEYGAQMMTNIGCTS
jgi:TPR repeat protein